MNIGITCYPTFGGSGVVAAELGMALADLGHKVHFISYAVPERLDLDRPNISYHEVTVPDYPLFEYPPYSLALASRIAECAVKFNLDIIHAHYAIPHALSALMARDMLGGNLPVVTTLHGTDVTLVGRDPSFLPITRYAIENSDAVSAVSHFLSAEVCRAFSCKRRINVIYNFIDPRLYSGIDSTLQRRQLAPDDVDLLIHISNFRPVKRALDVLKVFEKVRANRDARLLLVGNGPDLPLVMEKARSSGIDHYITSFGNQASVIESLHAADLLLLPSESESFGLVALEAMACGTPVVASRVGGLPELIDHGISGYLADVGDTDAMAEFAIRLLSDESLLKRTSDTARKIAFSRFSLKRALDSYLHLYNDISHSSPLSYQDVGVNPLSLPAK